MGVFQANVLRSGFVWALLFATFIVGLRAQTATGITGLYFTGVNDAGNLLVAPSGTGVKDGHWDVTYASQNAGAWQSTPSTVNEGDAYVVNTRVNGWISATSNAQWITAPGATLGSGQGANTGGTYLPGNGNAGSWNTGQWQSNMGSYYYTLKFNIVGSGSVGTTVTNNVSISLTIAADDQYRIMLNPYFFPNNTNAPSGSIVAQGNASWTNSTAFTLSNFGSGRNTDFKIGDNYLVVEVDNTNSIDGYSTSTALNPSGLMFYQTGNQFVQIGGSNYTLVGGATSSVVPECGTWLPVVAVIGLLGGCSWRRRKAAAALSPVVD